MFPNVRRWLSGRIAHRFLPLILAFFLLLVGQPPLARAQATPATNPDLTARCGLDIVLAIDESGSFQGFESTMRYGVRALLDLLADTGSRVALVEFNLDARTPLGPAYLPVTSGAGGTLGAGGAFDLYLNNNYQPNGNTNWDDAFLKINGVNQGQGVAPLVIFLTDGQPNAYVNQFGSILAGDIATSRTEAIPSANLVKAQGSHIFVVGIGTSPADEGNLIAVSDANPYPATTLRSGQADYVMTTLGGLEATLRRIAFDLCGSSLSVIKRENVGDGQGYVFKTGQLFTATVAIAESGQAADAFAWLEPVTGAAAQVGVTQAVATDSRGVARWQWIPGTQQTPQNWPSTVTLNEASQANTTVVAATCTRKYLDSNGTYQVEALSILPFPAAVAIGAYDLVTCDVRNAQLGISVTKKANPAQVPETGGDVVFTFDVTNNSTIAVRLTALNDTIFGNLHNQGTCVAGGSNVIAAGETYSCAVTKRLAGNAGVPHQNTVTATVVDANQQSVTAQATAAVNFIDALPPVTLSRSASPATLPEPGGQVAYTLHLSNNSAGEAVTLNGLQDTVYGDVTTVNGSVTATTCTAPQTLAPAGQAGATYSCIFTVQLAGPPGPYTDTLTATVSDDDGNTQAFAKDQLVTIINSLPSATLTVTPSPTSRIEPGGLFALTVVVANNGAGEALTLSSLTDSRYGNLTAVGGAVATTTCTLPQTLAPAGQPNATYSCTFTTNLLGAPGVYANTTQATVSDDDGGQLAVAGASDVEIVDSPATLAVTKRAARTSLPEPGGNMTFTVTVLNTSPVDHIRLDTVVDDKFGNIGATCVPALPVDLAPQQQVQCQFVRLVSGVVGERHVNEVVAAGVDDDGKPVTDRDQETIEITDLPARLDIIQVATPSNLPEPGGTVTFAALIENISTVDVIRIDRVETNPVNSIIAPIDVSSTCVPALPVNLQPGAHLHCSFTKLFTGPVGAQHTSQVVVTGVDDDGVPVKQSGYETVEIVDVAATLRVTKSANPVSVPEAGGIVNFSVEVQNTSAVDTITLNTLENNQFGLLNSACAAALPVTLAPGATLTCHFSRLISGDTGALVTLRTTATGVDDDGKPVSDDAVLAIGITDTPSSIKVLQIMTPTSLREPGGVAVYTIEVENTSAVDTVTIEQVTDSQFGDSSSGCTPALPASLAPQAKLLCLVTRTLTGAAGATFATTVSATGVDDDAQPVADFDLGTLDITDALPQVSVNLTAAPNRVLETGGVVTFTIALVNTGPEALTLERLLDSHGGSVQGRGTCRIPQSLPAGGGAYTCTYAETVAGAAVATYQALVTAEVSDDEGNRVQVADEADIFLIAVAPDLVLTKRDLLLVDNFTSEQDRGKPSPGDTLGYEIVVRNVGNGPATDVVLTDVPDANTTLVAGSVQTNRGTVAIGNTATDWLVVVSLGDLGSGEQATLSFQVTIIDGAGATLIRNQATLSQGITGASVAGSDDPDTPFFGDPTDTVVVIPPTALPPAEEPVAGGAAGRLFLPLIAR